MMDLHTSLRRLTIAMVGAIGISFLLPVSNARATGINDNIGKGADIMMKELRWPRWDAGTYYCQWYSYFYPERHCTFYGGVATHGPHVSPGVFTTFWAPTKAIYVGETFSGKGYGAEGARGGAGGHLSSLRPGAWFKFVMRVFPASHGRENEAFVGYWLKDVEKNEWCVHSILSVDTKATGFDGNSGFVEALAPNVQRVFERRLGYYRLDGKWHPSYMSTKGPQHIKLIEQDTALRFDTEYTAGKLSGPVVVKQPGQPVFDRLEIERSRSRAWKDQVIVTWRLPKSSPPQIAYKIEVFGNTQARGTPLKVEEDYAPHINVKRLDASGAPKAVRLTVTDLFDQKKSVVIPVEPITPVAADGADKLRSGLQYVYCEAPEETKWEQLPEFSELTPRRQGTVNGLDVSVQKGRYSTYALRYTGHLRVPSSGLYAFSLKSLDGSRLIIDGKVIGDNDGLHSRSEKLYPAALDAGTHEFELLYFRSRPGITVRQLEVLWEGPGINRRILTDSDFLCKTPPDTPSIKLTPAKKAVDPADNLITLQPEIDERGHEIERVEYFCGDLLLSTAEEKPFALHGILPEGENIMMARIWYDNGHSVDSNRLIVNSKNCIESWEFTSTGEKGLPLGVRCRGSQISLIGEGSCSLSQLVTADSFTFTARIANISLTKETGTHKNNWIGISMKGPGAAMRLVHTAGVGMRGKPDYRDLAGTNMSISRLTKGDWLRFVRRGNRYQSFTSVDGKTWTKTEEVIGGTDGEASVGFTFQVIPRGGGGVFHGALDNVKLEQGRVPSDPRRKPSAADLDLSGRIIALVPAPSQPGTIRARTADRGLIKTNRDGAVWQTSNRGLTSADALAVRSIAVHPGNANIALRGGGAVVDEKLVSGLWKTINDGKTWRLVTREIDFDGRGPTTVFGEVIAFCPDDPKIVAAGGETGGLFISKDEGETWQCVGLEGERITCLLFKGDQLEVGTCPDSELRALGLGRPVTPSISKGGIYTCDKSGADPKKTFELRDPTGVTRIDNMYFATTRGVYLRERVAGLRQPLYRLPTDTLFTALGSGAGGTYAAPLSDNPSRVYCAGNRFLWSILTDVESREQIRSWLRAGAGKEVSTMWDGYQSRKAGKDELLAPGLDSGGITCVQPDLKEENTLYVCNRDGILKSIDHGKSYTLVYRSPPKR